MFCLVSSGDSVVLFIVSPYIFVMHRAKHVHLVCVCLFVKQCIYIVFKDDLFFITYFLFLLLF